MSSRTLVALLFAALVAVPALASAQDRPADNWQMVREKLQADKKLAVAQGLAGTYQSMTDTTARRLLESTIAIYRDRQAMLESYLPKFRAVLPERKVARYYQIEQKIRAMLDYELASQIPLIR